MSQTYEQVEIVSETAVIVTERNGGVMTDRNGGVADRNGGDKEEKIKVKKSTKKHNSKFETMNTETMNTERDYEQVVFNHDDIPAEDDTFNLINTSGKKARKPKKRIVVVDKEEVVASEIVPQVALPLTMEESLFGTQRIDAVAEEDEVIAVITEEEYQLAQARLEWEQAGKTYKSLQDQVAKNKLKENIAEYRAEKIKDVDAGIEKLEQEYEALGQQIAKMKARRQEIDNGDFDEVLLNAVFLKKTEKLVKEKPEKEGKRAPPTKKERRSSVLFEDEELFRHRATRGGVLLNTIYCYYESATDCFQLCDEESNPITDGDDVVSRNGITFENLNQFIIYNNRQYVPEKVQRETAWAGSVCVFRDDEWISVGKL